MRHLAKVALVVIFLMSCGAGGGKGIFGVIQDSDGKPVSGVEVVIADSAHKTVTKKDGVFRFPFIEGSVNVVYRHPSVACFSGSIEKDGIRKDRYPTGVDLGAIKMPCKFVKAEDGKMRLESGGFIDNGDGTVFDKQAGLTWQRNGDGRNYQWDQAMAYCQNLELLGKGWRLPAKNELERVIRVYFFTTGGPSGRLSNYWSSTFGADSPSLAWRVGFRNGYVPWGSNPLGDYVRCVRDDALSSSP